MKFKKEIFLGFAGVMFMIFLTWFVLAYPVLDSGIRGHLEEDQTPTYTYNFTQNVTGHSPTDIFSIYSINSTIYPNLTSPSDYTWINIDSSTGIMTISSTLNNQTGNFTISVQVVDNNNEGTIVASEFIVNATNDAPSFININNEYNLTQNQNFLEYLNATDEEGHYPLIFNIIFNGNCTHASWSNRNANENCSLDTFGFSLTNASSVSAIMNFTPAKNDVGIYWANISVMDYGNSNNYGCPHIYCNNATYNLNKTTYYSTIVKFNIFSTLELNTDGCQNKVFQENQSNTCQINVTTKGEASQLNISSLAILRNYFPGPLFSPTILEDYNFDEVSSLNWFYLIWFSPITETVLEDYIFKGVSNLILFYLNWYSPMLSPDSEGVSNSSWFYSNKITNAGNFSHSIIINFTPQKSEIGNWTINFTVLDTTYNEKVTEQIYIYVNRTFNDAPELASITNINISADLQSITNLTVFDDDLLIPDKNDSHGGYNETITFSWTILNISNLNQQLSLSNFSIKILSMPVLENGVPTNKTTAEIRFTPEISDAGEYTINITVKDKDNSGDFEMFNLSVLSNAFPVWNQTNYNFFLTVNSTFATTTAFGPINLTNGYAVDTDSLTFANDTNAFPGFNLASSGIIVFTPYKRDVGVWSFGVAATDTLGLQNTTTFTYNISNINSNPFIETPLSAINASIDANSNINTSEDNQTLLTLWLQDEDFKVAESQKVYYNETLNVSVTIQGPNSNLFNFLKDSSFPTPGNNRSRYTAYFVPNKSDTGSYNITINVTDIANSFVLLNINMTIVEKSHNPVLISLTNQTSGINRVLTYNISATDAEDGTEASGELIFSYNFITGTDFIANNQNRFNTTSGLLSMTFNNALTGSYRLNITVRDSSGLNDSDDFWIFVYGIPNVTYPLSGFNFTLQENVTSNLTFRGDHSIKDNLTYELYINNALKSVSSYYGNDTNFSLPLTPNFTEETRGQFHNLTIIVYPSSSNLANASEINYTKSWNVKIDHANSPVNFNGHIGDKQATYNQDITINLSQYFSDIDHNDVYYNQTINFTIKSNSTPTYITTSVSNWILTLSSYQDSVITTELITINATDLNSTNNLSLTSAVSNNFQVQFIAPSTITTPSSGGGSSTETIPISLKIIIPAPVSAYKRDRIILPITLQNDGKKTLSGINLTGTIAKDNLIRDDILLSFDKSYFSSLQSGEKEETTLTINVSTDEIGTFEITINASVDNPDYHDWGKLYLTIKENEDISERILFTQEFLEQNPECIEFEELLKEAEEDFKRGDSSNAELKLQETIDACKNAISEYARSKKTEVTENKLYRYLIIAIIIVLVLIVAYHSYKRMKLKKSFKENI